MAIRTVINYPNGGKLLTFFGGKTKYIPSKAYEEARKKAKSTPVLSCIKGKSTFKNASELMDALFEEKIPGLKDEKIGKSTFSEAVHKVV